MSTKPFFYGVRVGRVPGVYLSSGACRKQVLGFSSAQCKKFTRSEDAWAFVNLPRSIQPPGNQNTLANGSAQVGSGHPVVGRRVFKQEGIGKMVTTKMRHRHRERDGLVLEEGTMALDDARTTLRTTHLLASGYPKTRSRTKVSTPESVTGPLAVFFAQYTNFEYNPDGSATDEFYRLCDVHGWDKDEQVSKKAKQVAKQGFQDALTMQFNDNYGTDVNDITKWQTLCAKLGMDPVPETVKACRETVRSTHVNLVDLVDIFNTREKARIFPTVVALSKYTVDHKKYFPRDNAHAGSLLKFLLRQIKNPRLSRNEGGHGRGGRQQGHGEKK